MKARRTFHSFKDLKTARDAASPQDTTLEKARQAAATGNWPAMLTMLAARNISNPSALGRFAELIAEATGHPELTDYGETENEANVSGLTPEDYAAAKEPPNYDA